MEQFQDTSDETSSDSDLLDRSLSMWFGWDGSEALDPIPLDLYTAAALGDYDCVRDLLARCETTPNRPNRFGWTPLMYASYVGHSDVVGLLVDRDVDVNLTTDNGTTALMFSASCGKNEVVALLYQNGARLDVHDHRGWSALFSATFSGHQRTVQLLVDLGADIHRIEHHHGLTPLMLAAAEGHEIIVSIFLEKGADTTLENVEGNTARSLAILNGHMNIVDLMDNWNTMPSMLRADPDIDLSSSDDSIPPLDRQSRRRSSLKSRVPSIQDGPALFAKMLSGQLTGPTKPRSQTADKDLQKGPMTRNTSSCVSNTVRFSTSSSSNESLAAALDFASHLGGLEHPQEGFIHSRVPRADPQGTPCDPTGQHLVEVPNFDLFNNLQRTSNEDILQSHKKTPSYRMATQPRLKAPVVRQVGYTPSIQPLSIPSNLPNNQCGIAPPSWNKSAGVPINHFDNQNTVLRSLSSEKKNKLLTELDKQNEPPARASSNYSGNEARDLDTLLESLNLSKYLPVFEEQDVDLRVFLTLTDGDLKEIGIKLMGPRRKMTNCIARWHSGARALSDDLEQVYADRMENALQEVGEKHQEALNRNLELETELIQERELRSVVEGCLVEDRKTYQRMLQLVTDTASICHRMREMYDNVRFIQNELLRRIKVNGIRRENSLCPDELARNLEIGLKLDRQFLGPSEDNRLGSDTLAHHGSQLGGGDTRASPQPITGLDKRTSDNSAIDEPLPLDDWPGEKSVNIQSLAMEDLMGHLSQVSHQMARVVAKATNNLDHLLEGQSKNLSPNSSSKSLS